LFFDLQRLPELFCGFERRAGEGPTLYPVACAPQAWASGSVFLLLQTCMGLSIQADQNSVCFTAPSLPPFIKEVRIEHLRIGDSSIDLIVDQSMRGIGVEQRHGDIDVIIR